MNTSHSSTSLHPLTVPEKLTSSACGAEQGLISVDQALDLIIEKIQPLAIETLPLKSALNRYLAVNIYSTINLPLFSQSAVDGYAICCHAVVESETKTQHSNKSAVGAEAKSELDVNVGVAQGAIERKIESHFKPKSDTAPHVHIQPNTEFELMGEVRAGQAVDVELKPGQAIRIFTGTQIPLGTSTVARQEIVQRLDASDHHNTSRIKILDHLHLHADIRDVGEEIQRGECIAQQGQLLSVGVMSALSMAGLAQVEVYQYPKIAVVITGDEIIAPHIAAHELSSNSSTETTEDIHAGKIFDANAPMIDAWFKRQNKVFDIVHVEDSAHAIYALLNRLKDTYDLILTTGGVSVGDYDFIRPVALELGFEQIFWKVKQKPGKPMFFAEYQNLNHSSSTKQTRHNQTIPNQNNDNQNNDHQNIFKPTNQLNHYQSHNFHPNNHHRCYLMGLPGNPAAVYVGLEVYVAHLIAAFQGHKKPLQWFSAVMSHDLKRDQRERFLRMFATFDQAILSVRSLGKQQSHMLSNLMQANCIVRIPANENIMAGQIVQGIFI